MRIAVIIPSRLQARRAGHGGGLWLDRALACLAAQVGGAGHELEIVVGLDPGAVPPPRPPHVRFAHGRAASQAAAVNAAVAASTGELLAFLEDDDVWAPRRLAYGLAAIGEFDLVSSNQVEYGEAGEFVQVNDYATPSGWLLWRRVWDRLGPFDEAVRFHVDTDYLGRINAAGLRRLHLLERGAPRRPWAERLAQFSQLSYTLEDAPLVRRTVNTGGGMWRVWHDPEARRISEQEHAVFLRKYGEVPW